MTTQHQPAGWGTPPPSQKPDAPKSRPFKAGFLGCFGVLAAIVVVIVAVAMLASSGSKTTAGTHTVVYDVTGTGATHSADLTLEGKDGTVQQNDQPVPWTYTRKASSGDFLYVSAQNKGSGDITCTITVDGAQLKTSTSSGAFAICQADGSL
jgi:hypothetical protein